MDKSDREHAKHLYSQGFSSRSIVEYLDRTDITTSQVRSVVGAPILPPRCGLCVTKAIACAKCKGQA